MIDADHIVLDACCIITIISSGKFEEIIQSLPAKCVVASYVSRNEALSYIDIDKQEIPIDLSQFFQANILFEIDLDYSSEVEATYVISLEARSLDSGEAESAAIAISRGWAIATDDRRATKVISSESPQTQILSTPHLIKFWADNIGVSKRQLQQVIRNIQKFGPRNDHPLFDWWQQHL